MPAKAFRIVLVTGLTIGVAQVPSQLLTGTPTESSSPLKHPTPKRTPATPATESATPALAVESPTTSLKPKRIRRKPTAEVSPSPTPTPVASPTPRKFKLRFPRLFKRKTPPSATPTAVNPAPATATTN